MSDDLFPMGNELKDAKLMFELITDAIELPQLAEAPEGKEVSPMMGHWMRSGDEIALMLFNKKLWNVQYAFKADDGEISVSPPSDEDGLNAWMRIAHMTWGLRFLVCRAAIEQAFEAKKSMRRMEDALRLMRREDEDIIVDDSGKMRDPVPDEIYMTHFLGFLEQVRELQGNKKKMEVAADIGAT